MISDPGSQNIIVIFSTPSRNFNHQLLIRPLLHPHFGCVPRCCKGAHDLVPLLDGLDFTASFDDNSSELVAHNEPRLRLLVTTEYMEFTSERCRQSEYLDTCTGKKSVYKG